MSSKSEIEKELECRLAIEGDKVLAAQVQAERLQSLLSECREALEFYANEQFVAASKTVEQYRLFVPHYHEQARQALAKLDAGMKEK